MGAQDVWMFYFGFQLIRFHTEWHFRSSLERLQLKQIGLGQLHWSTANYAPLQERALWDGLVAMYEKVIIFMNHIVQCG